MEVPCPRVQLWQRVLACAEGTVERFVHVLAYGTRHRKTHSQPPRCSELSFDPVVMHSIFSLQWDSNTQPFANSAQNKPLGQAPAGSQPRLLQQNINLRMS